MPVRGFDHYNLRAAQPLLDELRDFYRDVVGLTVGERPPFRRFGYWLYAGDRAVLHLAESDPHESRARNVATTFAHAAFNCTDRPEYERLLDERGIRFRVDRVPMTNLVQLFFQDPAGNGVELQFDAADGE
jgi:catechol 2,3-dioxygenase-like lactoylglutathione lyase family enzyme